MKHVGLGAGLVATIASVFAPGCSSSRGGAPGSSSYDDPPLRIDDNGPLPVCTLQTAQNCTFTPNPAEASSWTAAGCALGGVAAIELVGCEIGTGGVATPGCVLGAGLTFGLGCLLGGSAGYASARTGTIKCNSGLSSQCEIPNVYRVDQCWITANGPNGTTVPVGNPIYQGTPGCQGVPPPVVVTAQTATIPLAQA